jgi:hypothetical protein
MPLPPDLSKPVFQLFPQAANSIINGECVPCGSTQIRDCDFRDDISKKEYSISGMCQSCQDQVFNMMERMEDDDYHPW